MPGVALNGPRAFVFGKLPRHGDFLSRGLPAAAGGAWDAWLSGAIEAASSSLGPAWREAHDATPPWRFIDPPGDFGAGWRAGALAASVDSAGRRFFIVVGVDSLEEALAPRAHLLAEAMEDLIYQAFQEGWDVDTLAGAAGRAAELWRVAVEPAPQATATARWWMADGPVLDGRPHRLVEPAPTPVPAEPSA